MNSQSLADVSATICPADRQVSTLFPIILHILYLRMENGASRYVRGLQALDYLHLTIAILFRHLVLQEVQFYFPMRGLTCTTALMTDMDFLFLVFGSVFITVTMSMDVAG